MSIDPVNEIVAGTKAMHEAAAEIQRLRAENERLRGLWRDEALISRLFWAHMRGDVATALREALDK